MIEATWMGRTMERRLMRYHAALVIESVCPDCKHELHFGGRIEGEGFHHCHFCGASYRTRIWMDSRWTGG
mgnify:CR=1 FL=1